MNYGDITRLTADALVSSDDNYLSMGGGVSAALSRVGGEIVSIEARKHTPLNIGDVAVTSAEVFEPDLEAVFLQMTGKALRE